MALLQRLKKQKKTDGIIIASLLLLIVFAVQLILMVSTDSNTFLSASNSYSQALPDGYLYMSCSPSEIHSGNLILINADNLYNFEDNDINMLSIYENKNKYYMAKDKNVLAAPQLVSALNQLMEDFYNTTQLEDVIALSGYRSLEKQQELYDNSDKTQGSPYWTAAPGASEHHSGLAVDLGIYREGASFPFDGKDQYSYIISNAYRYGLIVRYDQAKSDITGVHGEPWHLRYVGQAHAQYMFEQNLCLEEYIALLREHAFEQEHLFVKTYSGSKYEIYYVSAENCSKGLPVPEDMPFTVSGNNIDGFIVTIKTA